MQLCINNVWKTFVTMKSVKNEEKVYYKMITRLYTLFLAPNDRAKARLGGYIAAGPPPPPLLGHSH